MRRTVSILAAMALAVGVSLIATPANAAPARANGQTNPVIFIHGYTSTDCNSYWATTKNYFAASSRWTGARVTYGYYSADTNCTREYAGTTNSSLKTIGKDLANWIYNTYSKNGVKVDVVAHSMGGLIIRSALTEVAKKTAGWPAYLYVEDVVTLGTPHDGALLAGGFCVVVNNTQCTEMSAASTFLKGLAARPVSAMGTDWTNIGSWTDVVVSAPSATYMNGQHRIQYAVAAGLSHGALITTTTSKTARTMNNGSAWSTYSTQVGPVAWARNAVYNHSAL